MVHEGLIAIAEKEREVTYSGQFEICPTETLLIDQRSETGEPQ